MSSERGDWFLFSYSTRDFPFSGELRWAFRKEANMMKLTISEIHLDVIQDYIFI